MTHKDSFSKLCKLSKTISSLHSIQALLGWDQETYMPSDAIQGRSDQLELLSSIIHKSKTSPTYKKALSDLIDLDTGKIKQESSSKEIRACAREWRRNYLQDTKLSSSFVKRFTKITSSAVHVWSEAKKNNNFSLFLPHLEKVVSLSRKKAELLGYKDHPYDALLDLYEPNLTVAKITPLFAELKEALIDLLNKIPKTSFYSPFTGSFCTEKQKKVANFLLEVMGFSSQTSRLDLSSHPFCSGIDYKDTRMTTRIDPYHPASNIYSVLHEGGHALYHQNLPEEHYGTPLYEAASYGIDESQSRLWETILGKSKAFCSFLYPILKETFPENLSSCSFDDFYQYVNQVHPSEIRVEADEVTYSLHIILRFEIEKSLMEGSLSVKDIPTVWNKKMEEMLGILPENDTKGCLQDIHWAMGGIGYFPTYTFGNLLAAQIFSTLKNNFPYLQDKLSQGETSFIQDWLKENIHRHGKLHTPEELILNVTKKPLGAEDYIRYLKEKFLP